MLPILVVLDEFMKQITFRLKPGELLKERIEQVAVESNILAGCLLSIVGGLDVTFLRMADAVPDKQEVREWREPMEIVSGTGTISNEGCHIHVSVSDTQGRVFGGHLKDGCVVKFTAEITLLVFDDVKFTRVFDEATGFKELVVEAS